MRHVRMVVVGRRDVERCLVSRHVNAALIVAGTLMKSPICRRGKSYGYFILKLILRIPACCPFWPLKCNAARANHEYIFPFIVAEKDDRLLRSVARKHTIDKLARSEYNGSAAATNTNWIKRGGATCRRYVPRPPHLSYGQSTDVFVQLMPARTIVSIIVARQTSCINRAARPDGQSLSVQQRTLHPYLTARRHDRALRRRPFVRRQRVLAEIGRVVGWHRACNAAREVDAARHVDCLGEGDGGVENRRLRRVVGNCSAGRDVQRVAANRQCRASGAESDGYRREPFDVVLDSSRACRRESERRGGIRLRLDAAEPVLRIAELRVSPADPYGIAAV